MKTVLKKMAFSLVVFLLCKTTAYSQLQNCQEMYNPDIQTSNIVNSSPVFDIPSTSSNDFAQPTGQNPDDRSYPDTQRDRKYVYRVIYHVIRNGAGVRVSQPIGENECMNSILNLNVAYNKFNIFFKYGGVQYDDKDEMVGSFSTGQLTSVFRQLYNRSNFHIIILDGDITGTVDGHNAIVPGVGLIWSTVSFYSPQGFQTNRVVMHEVGHNFYLYHDFKNHGDTFSSEHVTRDFTTNNVGFNADGAGDQIFDTPATKIWSDNLYNELGIYTGFDVDDNISLPASSINRLFRTEEPRNNNIMHVHDGHDYESGYSFTDGQGKRIRWALALDHRVGYHYWMDAEIPYEELYQPFEIKYLPGNVIIRTSDNGDGTAKVCRNVIMRNRFQKGFHYTFYDEENNITANTNPNELKEIDGFNSDYNKVLLAEYSPTIRISQVPICNRLETCANEPYVRGLVFSTEILGSMNITVRELNELQVKDPQLYNQLLEEYYYILKKVTESGAEVNTVFYKP